MERLDERRLLQLLEWLDEAEDDVEDDNEPDDLAKTRADRLRKIASGEIERPEDPSKAQKLGHKRINPFDMSGKNPEENPVKGTIAPKLAGERAKAIMVLGRLQGFIDKYSDMAVAKFGGAKAPGEGGTASKVGAGADFRAGSKGNVKGMQQMMSKDKVMQMLEKLPMMPGSQMMFAIRAIGSYIWAIHATARDEIRNAVKGRLKGGGQIPFRKKFNPETGEEEDTKSLDTDDPHYKDSIKAASREFDEDSLNVKADLNMLASVAGVLKRSGGFGGAADKVFLRKIVKSYIDKETGERRYKAPEIEPLPSDVNLSKVPAMDKLAADPEELKAAAAMQGPKAKGPTVRKKGDKKESIDIFMDRILEIASGNNSPKWWDDM